VSFDIVVFDVSKAIITRILASHVYVADIALEPDVAPPLHYKKTLYIVAVIFVYNGIYERHNIRV